MTDREFDLRLSGQVLEFVRSRLLVHRDLTLRLSVDRKRNVVLQRGIANRTIPTEPTGPNRTIPDGIVRVLSRP